VTRTEYDDLGRVTARREPDSVVAPDGSEQPVERVTRWDYGDLGRVVTVTRPDGAVLVTEYDERGNMTASVDADGGRTEYSYDELGRLESVTYPGDTVPRRAFTYLPDGEVDVITLADGRTVDHAYEPLGRLDTVTV
jgi:YD repeat-containing protein